MYLLGFNPHHPFHQQNNTIRGLKRWTESPSTCVAILERSGLKQAKELQELINMSYYITIHHGSGVDESPGNLWVNLSFTIKEHFYLRTDGALICYMMERIREKKFKLTSEPWDRRSRWCISIPVSKMHETKDGAAADALQLAEWYRVQILNGNATINRELLFDRKPFYDGKECCRGNVCDLILHPEWWLPDPSSDASSDP